MTIESPELEHREDYRNRIEQELGNQYDADKVDQLIAGLSSEQLDRAVRDLENLMRVSRDSERDRNRVRWLGDLLYRMNRPLR